MLNVGQTVKVFPKIEFIILKNQPEKLTFKNGDGAGLPP